jgi:hypothetical protein
MKWDYAFLYALGSLSSQMEPWWAGDINNIDLATTVVVALLVMPIVAFVFRERMI